MRVAKKFYGSVRHNSQGSVGITFKSMCDTTIASRSAGICFRPSKRCNACVRTSLDTRYKCPVAKARSALSSGQVTLDGTLYAVTSYFKSIAGCKADVVVLRKLESSKKQQFVYRAMQLREVSRLLFKCSKAIASVQIGGGNKSADQVGGHYPANEDAS